MRTIISMFCLLFVCNFCVNAQTGSCNELIIPDIITPNNDGINDDWVIECIENFPDNELQVYNRWGQMIYHAFGYDNNWDGTWDKTKGDAPDGTYVYIIKVKVNGEEKTTTGALTIKR